MIPLHRVSIRSFLAFALLTIGMLLHLNSPFGPGLTRAFQADVAIFSLILAAYSVYQLRQQHPDMFPNAWRSIDFLMVTIDRVVPPPVGHVVKLEISVWASLWRLIARRQPRHEVLTYHRQSSAAGLILLTVVTAPAEILLFELLIPWSWLRIVLLALAAYGLIWLAGMVAVPRAFPHELSSTWLTLRSGATTRWELSRSSIAGIELDHQTYPRTRQVMGTRIQAGQASMLVDGRTNMRIDLRHPLHLHDGQEVTTVYCFVDQPDRLIAWFTPPTEALTK